MQEGTDWGGYRLNAYLLRTNCELTAPRSAQARLASHPWARSEILTPGGCAVSPHAHCTLTPLAHLSAPCAGARWAHRRARWSAPRVSPVAGRPGPDQAGCAAFALPHGFC